MIVSSNGGTIAFAGVTVTVPNSSGTATITETIEPIIDNGGIIEATNGGTITFTGATVTVPNPNGTGTITETIGPTIYNFDTVTIPGSPGGTGNPPSPPTPPITTTYYGTIEATGAGSDVQFVNTVVDNPNGAAIEANNGGTLTLEGSAIANGGLMAASGSGSSLIDTGGTDVNAGSTIAEQQGTVAFVLASVQNQPAGAMTATSGGTLQFEASALTNDGTITADGGTVIIDNTQLQNFGLIVAQNTGTVTLADATNSSAFTFVNTGTVEAGSGGTLNIIDATLANTYQGANTGVIEALSGGQIVLENAVIDAGSVTIASGATLATVSANGTTVPTSINEINTANGQDNLSTVTLSNAGTIAISDNSSLALASPDTISNTGTIQLNSTGDATTLYIDQPFAGINGGGQIVLSNSAGNVIAAATSGDQLTNFDNTISGAGTIGAGGMALVNSGTIDADGSVPLILDPASLTNNGTLEATAGGELSIRTDVGNSGLIEARGGSTLDVTAGTITWTGGTPAAGTNGIVLAGSNDELLVDSASLTLNGGGAVATAGIITGAATTDQLVNVDNTISGSGTIDNLTLTNEAAGTIDADQATALILNPASLSNAGLVEANGGLLEINDSPVTNTGTLKATGGGTVVLNGETVANSGTVQVDLGATLDQNAAVISGGSVTVAGTLDFDRRQRNQQCHDRR